MDNATFSYQWIRNDGGTDTDISGATGSSYTVAVGDAGKAIKVRVSFTDDAGNEETLFSAATAAVEPKPNSPATGAPSITGTAQVGETLTAGTSGIADADGLDSVAFAYQWVADDVAIQGATGSRYTLADSDDRSNAESLTSEVTSIVAPVTPS